MHRALRSIPLCPLDYFPWAVYPVETVRSGVGEYELAQLREVQVAAHVPNSVGMKDEVAVVYDGLEVELPPSRRVLHERLHEIRILIVHVQEEHDAEWVGLAALYTDLEDACGLSVGNRRPKRWHVQTDGVKETIYSCQVEG